MLEDYAQTQGFPNPVHYTDDGFSGGSFERPDWKRMVADIESGLVGCVITKDMSRIGRDYLQVGFYTEVLFREKGVRFIAIANGVDSQVRSSSEFAPFLNIMNEWYLRDCSRKVTAVLRARGMEGKRTTNHAIYGYRKDPQDRDRWLVDEEAAEVVRRIFRMSVEGYGCYAIARTLTAEQVERPSCYLARRNHGAPPQLAEPESAYTWSGNTVANILSKPEYKGHTVNFRSVKESYKDKRATRRPPEEWVIFENTHEPLVDAETWALAQKLRQTRRRQDTTGEANPLTGLVFCADCGAKLHNHRGRRDHYSCSTYDLAVQKFRRVCSMHYVSTAALREEILRTIRAVCLFARSRPEDFAEQVRAASAVRQEETANSLRQRIRSAHGRCQELDRLIRRVYEDNAGGKLSDKRFARLLEDYEREQQQLEAEAEQAQAALDAFQADTLRIDQFLKLAGKYQDFTELSTPMINEFVERILVHEADRSTGERRQELEIHLNYIGRFTVPEPEPTPEERLREEQRRQYLARKREQMRRYAEQKRQKS